MAYIALSARDSSFLLLGNGAPRLPRRSGVTAASSWSLADATAVRPLRALSPSAVGTCLSSKLNPRGRRMFASVEGNVTVEEAAVSAGSDAAEAASEEKVPEAGGATEGGEAGAGPAKQLQRSNTVRRQTGGAKREITVAKERIVEGAVFTGRVRSIQSYGAFVDIGAFTDGLVHISELSAAYVKDVSDVVQLGQEVSVTVVEMNEKDGRIRLTMRDRGSEAEQGASRSGGESGAGSGGQEEDGSGRPMNRGKIAGRGTGNARAKSRSSEEQKTTKLKKGQELKGTVKNIIRNGAFIEFLEEGEEGFLRGSEIQEGGENVAVESLLTVGQEVTVRVLKIERGKAALTMKPQVDVTSINDSINTNVGAGGASNPFATFFRSANLIPESPASVDAQEVTPAAAEEVSAVQGAPAVEETAAAEEQAAIQEEPAAAVEGEDCEEEAAPVEEITAAVEEPAAAEESPAVEDTSAAVEETPAVEEPAAAEERSAVEASSAAAEETPAVEEPAAGAEEPAAVEESPAVEESSGGVQESPAVEASAAAEEEPAVDESPATDAVSAKEDGGESGEAEEPRSLSLGEIAEGIGSAVQEVEKVVDTAAEGIGSAAHEVEKVVEAAADLLSVGDKDGAASDETTEAAASSTEEAASGGGESAEASGEGEVEVTQEAVAAPEAEAVSEAPVAVAEEAKAGAVEVEAKGAGSASGPTAAQVKELREKSGAGMMECKKALVACGSDMEKASEYLRKKGLASAEKKASRIAAEGRVGSYVHDGRIGVLIEVNCETDFVSRGTQFKELVADMGMQVVACPDVKYVSVDDVPGDFVAKEKQIEMGKEDLASKPAQIRERIVEGRVAKRLAELALLEQAYIRDDKVLVKDHVKEAIAKLGEKIQVRRFVRFNLGEGLQKKSVDFAAEVAAQTAAKADAMPAAGAPKVAKEEEGPKVAVSAATVKQLREATGAGMMDCKKALGACENDVEKATEYLRKKGLASADKKSGRIASEGLIGSYIHDGRIGVLVEVNSETDFVARSKEFKELVANIAMQVAACPQVQYVTVDEVPAEFIEKEKAIEAGKEDLAKRPEAIREKIVEGRVAKTLNELALLEQAYIRDDKILVRDYVKQTIAALGENIQVRRFVRFNLGEGIEKRSTDFAAEVAAQTGGRA